MRHGKKDNHLGRTASHRRAMLSNMASSLILHKRIETTLAKAKELRKYVEPLLTRSKDDSTHSRRIVFSYLNDKDSVKELFNVVSDKIADRPGGYTRIIKLGTRQGDAAETCLIELVDFNEALLLTEADKTTKTRRSRRGGKKSGAASESTAPAEDAAPAAKAAPAVTDEAPAAAEEASGADAPGADAPGADAPGADAPADDVKPASDETEETEK